MKTAEEIALEFGLCRCIPAYKDRNLNDPDCPFHSSDVEGAMEAYADQFRKAALSPAKQEWVKVSERQPKEEQIVLCILNNGMREVSPIYTISYWRTGDVDDNLLWFMKTFSYWMPLPALPYTEEK